MILCGHQPNYLPGLQLFNKIMWCDAFAHVPHVEFEKKSWQSRNFIKTGMLSVPVNAEQHDRISQVKVDYTKNWQRKHLRAIQMAYAKAPFFKNYYPDIEWLIGGYQAPSLAALNMNLMDYLTQWLECGKFDKCFYTAPPGYYYKPVDMIITMCKAVNAEVYVSNQGAKAYLSPEDINLMQDHGIRHAWQQWTDPDYGQGKLINDGRLSVLDLLFTHGPEASKIIREAGCI